MWHYHKEWSHFFLIFRATNTADFKASGNLWRCCIDTSDHDCGKTCFTYISSHMNAPSLTKPLGTFKHFLFYFFTVCGVSVVGAHLNPNHDLLLHKSKILWRLSFTNYWTKVKTRENAKKKKIIKITKMWHKLLTHRCVSFQTVLGSFGMIIVTMCNKLTISLWKGCFDEPVCNSQ